MLAFGIFAFIASHNTSFSQVDPNPEIDYEVIIKGGAWAYVIGVLGIDNNEAFIMYGTAEEEGDGYVRTETLAHVSAQGEILNELFFHHGGITIGKMDISDSYLAMGYQHVEEERAYLISVFKFNRELQIEWEKVIDTMYYKEGLTFSEPRKMIIKSWNNTYYLTINGQGWSQSPCQKSVIYKMDSEGNILMKKDIYPAANAISDIQYISHIPGTNRFLMNTADRETVTDQRTWVMSDETLERVSTLVLPNPWCLLEIDLDMEYINETEFIYVGGVLLCDANRQIGLRKGTVNNLVMKTRYFHWNRFNGPSGVRGGLWKTMALQNNYFYICMVDQMFNKTNNLIVAAFDHELDSLWTAYIKRDDADYWIISITPMSDGSCLIGARRDFYFDDGGSTADAYFVKIKTPEVLQNLGFVTKQKEIASVVVYPNPTSGVLRIGNGELRIDNIEVFDVYGRKLSSYHRQHQIDISHLPTGIYIVKINTEAGEVVRKVLKE